MEGGNSEEKQRGKGLDRGDAKGCQKGEGGSGWGSRGDREGFYEAAGSGSWGQD